MSLESEFERCRPWLAASTHADVGDLWAQVSDGRAQLWPAPDAVVVTQVRPEGERLILTLWIVGGALRTAKRVLPLIEAEMKRAGCVETRFAPQRPGWERLGRWFGFNEVRPGVWGRGIA